MAEIIDEDTQTTSCGILRTIVRFLKDKFARITGDDSCIAIFENEIYRRINVRMQRGSMSIITESEVYKTLRQRAKRNSAGDDGLSLEFYTTMWDQIEDDLVEVYNEMLRPGENITTNLTTGIIVCILEHAGPKTPHDYRSITLLHTEYKLLARIIANRLRPILDTIIHPGQHCGGIPDRNIYIAGIRDVVPYAEITGNRLSVLSLDFSAAFDRVSHNYLF
jgi:hypothetical protein